MRSANLRLRTVDGRRTAALSGVGRTSHAASSPPTHARPSRAASHPCAPSLSLPDRRIAGHAERMDGLDSSAQRQRAKVRRTDLGRRVTAESVAMICARLLGPDRTIVSLRMRPSRSHRSTLVRRPHRGESGSAPGANASMSAPLGLGSAILRRRQRAGCCKSPDRPWARR